MFLPRSVERLIAELARFPGVGRRSAERMAFDLVAARETRVEPLVLALDAVAQAIGTCPCCGYFTEAGECLMCRPGRDSATLLVVERIADVIALEKAGGFRGRYHVLGGHLSPLKGITPDQLRIGELDARIDAEGVREVILATSPTVEGDATALYLGRHLHREGLHLTRLGRGVPMGGALDTSDAGTLRMALEGRQAVAS